MRELLRANVSTVTFDTCHIWAEEAQLSWLNKQVEHQLFKDLPNLSAVNMRFPFCLKDGYDVIVESPLPDVLENDDKSVKEIKVGHIFFL